MPPRLRGKAWMKLRAAVLAQRPACVDCGDWAKEVHHANENAADNRWENLAPLCVSCHLKRHGKGPRLQKGWARLMQK